MDVVLEEIVLDVGWVEECGGVGRMGGGSGWELITTIVQVTIL